MASVNLPLLVYYLVFFSIQFCDVAELAMIHQTIEPKEFKHPFYIFGYLLEINMKSENSFSKMVI
jgi:hypothetical protein